MKKNESWFEFMDRAKKNGSSPNKQEGVDKEEDARIEEGLMAGAGRIGEESYKLLNGEDA